jgi:hypothetical protein
MKLAPQRKRVMLFYDVSSNRRIQLLEHFVRKGPELHKGLPVYRTYSGYQGFPENN